MSIDGSQREYILCLFLSKFPDILEKLLRLKLLSIQLDKSIGNGRKVDLFAVAGDERPVYVEAQLSNCDIGHYLQLVSIIQLTRSMNFILVWISKDFSDEFLNKIDVAINNSGKIIEFFAIKLTEDLKELDILNDLHPFELMQNLSMLNNVQDKLKIKKIKYLVKDFNILSSNNKQEMYTDDNVNSKEKLLRNVLNELRKEIYWYAPLFKDKSLTNGLISIGSGKSDISFGVGINRYKQFYVNLRFNDNVRDMLECIYKSKDKIDSDFDFLIEWELNYRKIATYFDMDNKKQDIIIKRLVRITSKYIRYFVDFIIKYENEQHKIL